MDWTTFTITMSTYNKLNKIFAGIYSVMFHKRKRVKYVVWFNFFFFCEMFPSISPQYVFCYDSPVTSFTLIEFIEHNR